MLGGPETHPPGLAAPLGGGSILPVNIDWCKQSPRTTNEEAVSFCTLFPVVGNFQITAWHPMRSPFSLREGDDQR